MAGDVIETSHASINAGLILVFVDGNHVGSVNAFIHIGSGQMYFHIGLRGKTVTRGAFVRHLGRYFTTQFRQDFNFTIRAL